MRFMDARQHAMQLAPPAVGGALTFHVLPSRPHSHSIALASIRQDTGPSTSVNQQKGSNLTALPGRKNYEDMCMEAVNQCVGRVTRHRNDYAADVLADARWCTSHVGVAQGKSPLKVSEGP